MDIMPSMTRIKILSIQGTKPVTRPIANPITEALIATQKPTVRETRAPYRTRE